MYVMWWCPVSMVARILACGGALGGRAYGPGRVFFCGGVGGGGGGGGGGKGKGRVKGRGKGRVGQSKGKGRAE